jgi:Trk K+ transport system NAD-binding subunit
VNIRSLFPLSAFRRIVRGLARSAQPLRMARMHRSPFAWIFRYIRALLRDSFLLFREFWGSLVALLVVSLAVATLFYFFYPADTPSGRLPFDEALFLVVTLTVIDGSYPIPDENHWLILFYFLMPFVGILLAGQGLVNFLTLLFNRQARGQAWKVALAGTLSNHVVVCGGGRVGSNVALRLSEAGSEVVLIEQTISQETIERFAKQNLVVLQGDVRDYELLKQAGIERANAVVVCTDDDLANLESAIHCRELNEQIRIVLRMFDADLAQKVKDTFEIEVAYSSSALAAPVFAGVALDLNIQQSFYVGDTVMAVARLKVVPGSRLDGLTVGMVEEIFDLSLIMAIQEEKRDLHPATDRALVGGMTVLALAELPILYKLAGWVRPPRQHPIVVCGGGRVGSNVALTLLEAGADVIVIEQNLRQAPTQRLTKRGIPVIEGDVRDYDLLRQAGIETAASVVICTDNDLANLESAIHCRDLNPNTRIIMRMYDAALARKVKETFDIHAAYSSSALAAPVFAGAALDLEVQQSFTISGEVISIGRLGIRPGARLNGMSVGEVESQFDVNIIMAIQNGDKDFHPAPTVMLKAGMMILVLGELPALQRLGNRVHP